MKEGIAMVLAPQLNFCKYGELAFIKMSKCIFGHCTYSYHLIYTYYYCYLYHSHICLLHIRLTASSWLAGW